MLLDISDEAQCLSGGRRLCSKLFQWMNLLVRVILTNPVSQPGGLDNQ